MTITTNEVSQGLLALLGTFKAPRDLANPRVQQVTVTAWQAGLSARGVTAQEWQRAVVAYITTGREWPEGLGALLDLVPRLKAEAEHRGRDWSGEGWSYLLGLAAPHQFYPMNKLVGRGEALSADPVMDACLKAGLSAVGGFSGLARTAPRELDFRRRDFCAAFKAEADRWALRGHWPSERAFPTEDRITVQRRMMACVGDRTAKTLPVLLAMTDTLVLGGSHG